jgi:hypothetical protein
MSSLANLDPLGSKHKEISLLAPENFSMVEDGVYRSAFPRTKNSPFLRRLGLRSVISLVPEDYPTPMLDMYDKAGIRFLAVGMDGNKYPFKEIDMTHLFCLLVLIMDPAARPLLVHCNKGKHRTGCVIAALRRIRGWALGAIFAEYLIFAGSKSRLEDQLLIESFDPEKWEQFRTSLEMEKSRENDNEYQGLKVGTAIGRWEVVQRHSGQTGRLRPPQGSVLKPGTLRDTQDPKDSLGSSSSTSTNPPSTLPLPPPSPPPSPPPPSSSVPSPPSSPVLTESKSRAPLAAGGGDTKTRSDTVGDGLSKHAKAALATITYRNGGGR